MASRVLCLLAEGFEEIETITPVDLLRRAGIEVVLAALGDHLLVKGRCSVLIQADSYLSELNTSDFDLLFLPGGPGVAYLRQDGRAGALAKEFMRSGRKVAAICAAPLVLHDAGLLEGKKYTAHDSTYAVLTEAEPAEQVIVDGHLITSRGAGTAFIFGLALISALLTEAEASIVARSVMA
ncbi:DJ-1 family glyoxalase III [Prosthecobacter dejongeii]|uniref:4-methyl-5(B-hydroxyethyl)-thiazole monophosphate biosynthesis n=1 Tax=Prosthecobacter dejongeii TaxID=48465 RepID=A0A7W8DQG5_9BACT|nr:DJ-1 family glyoxalase III [Prosthecobacter dejongeii]MBB5038297.1 4-methyl-5(b-hydroxyethyl)-thiazole monophosphate biosynthesis [Prosthecobacter dejongeii]